jgi:sec-independent protein translocase protein TatB
MAAEFQGQFQEALREAEMEDLKKQVNEITDSARELTHFDPLEPVKSEIESAKSEFDSSFDAIRVDEPSPTEAADATPEATQPALSVAEPATTIHEPATVEPLPPDSAETRPAATPSAHEAEVDPVPEPPAPKIAAGGHSA